MNIVLNLSNLQQSAYIIGHNDFYMVGHVPDEQPFWTWETTFHENS